MPYDSIAGLWGENILNIFCSFSRTKKTYGKAFNDFFG